jgi:hypothetical protein
MSSMHFISALPPADEAATAPRLHDRALVSRGILRRLFSAGARTVTAGVPFSSLSFTLLA